MCCCSIAVISDSLRPHGLQQCQASLSFTISLSLLKLMSIELVMPSNHLICRPLLPLSSVFPSIRVFSNDLALRNCWVVCRFYTTEITSHLLTCMNSTERKIHHPIPPLPTLVVSLTVKKPCILFTYSSMSLIICYIFYWPMTACLACARSWGLHDDQKEWWFLPSWSLKSKEGIRHNSNNHLSKSKSALFREAKETQYMINNPIYFYSHLTRHTGFPGGSVVKNLPSSAGDVGSISGLAWSPGGGNGNPLQYSCLESPMDRGAWRAI